MESIIHNKKIILANFKAEQNFIDAKNWLNEFIRKYKNLISSNPNISQKEIILCPTYLYLNYFKEEIEENNLPFLLGSQDISQFENGKYTGEVTGKMLQDLVSYVIIGHSERRINMHETSLTIQKKIEMANKNNLKVVLCLEKGEPYTGEIDTVLYETLAAIGSGNAEDPIVSKTKLSLIKEQVKAKQFIYGGSVNYENVNSYLSAGFSGIGVGKKSLDSEEFLKIVRYV